MPQLRQNIITGEWVVFAPERAKRPTDYVSSVRKKIQDKSKCPFCLDSSISEYPNRKIEYDLKNTYLITNKYPAFFEEPDLENAKLYRLEDEFFKMKLALGGHDVVVCKDHDIDLPNFSEGIFKDIFTTFKQRSDDFAENQNVEHIMPIYNHGPAAAASIEHPHAQIIASAVVPNTIARELSHTSAYFSTNKRCVFCDLIEHEKSQNTRVLFENDDFIAFNFYAARFPFEVWILPKKHCSDFREIIPEQIKSLSRISRDLFSRLGETLTDPDLNFFIHSSPLKDDDPRCYHWHMEVAPRLTTYGGYELGSGMVIDIISPESAAEFLRLSKKE